MDTPLNSDDIVDIGEEHHKAGRLQEAESCYRRALEIDSGHPGALYYLANIALADGRMQFAGQLIDELLRGEPNDVEAWHLLGMVALKEGNFSRAIECLNKALAIQPAYVQAYYSLGIALNSVGKLDAALENFQRAVNLKSDFAQAYIGIGQILLSQGKWDEAITISQKAIAENAGSAPVHFALGVAYGAKNDNAAAAVSFERAIALEPNFTEAYNYRGLALNNLGRYDQALVCCDKSIALKPDFAEAHNNRGNALRELKRLDEALVSYDRAIALNPGFVEAYNNRGIALNNLKRLDEALACCDKVIALKPDLAEAHNNRGNALQELKRLNEALVSYDRAIALNPGFVEAHNNRGNALRELKRLDDALGSSDKAIALKPNFAEAHNSRGNALRELRRLDEALISYDRAIALNPTFAEANSNRGNALRELRRLDEALVSCDEAIALKSDFAEAHNSRGNALRELRRLDEALVSCDKAIALRPDFAEAHNSRGNALQELKRREEALVSYDRAIALNPDFAEAHGNRASVLVMLRRLDEAVISYDKAIALKPDYAFLLGALLHTKMMICDWQGFGESLKSYEAAIRSAKKVTVPFAALALLDSPELLKQAAKIFADTKYPKAEHLGAIKKREKGGRIRVGYYSADFYNHATAYLMAELLEAHDATRFELFGFSFGPNIQDEMRQRVSSAFDHFYDVSDKNDLDIARYSRELGIDIAIDLKGFTNDARPGIFAERCAPIQVNYLGYPGTMGVDYMDYIIADTTVIPKERQSDYAEMAVYLPHSYQVNDSERRISARAFTRQELGLPESGFVFCCFNNNYKMLPSIFDVWMRILKAVEGSVLWLFEDNPTVVINLRKEAASRGLDSNRLIFAKRMPLDEHLARHRLADLFIDTLPCNAHTTASDALWAGLPVLTCMGKSFASRVAASLLNAIELPELITHTEAEYEAKAIELASNAEKLSAIKRKLEKNRLTTPLFNAKLFARHIESAYEAMYDRYQAGLAPETIEVKACD